MTEKIIEEQNVDAISIANFAINALADIMLKEGIIKRNLADDGYNAGYETEKGVTDEEIVEYISNRIIELFANSVTDIAKEEIFNAIG